MKKYSKMIKKKYLFQSLLKIIIYYTYTYIILILIFYSIINK